MANAPSSPFTAAGLLRICTEFLVRRPSPHRRLILKLNYISFHVRAQQKPRFSDLEKRLDALENRFKKMDDEKTAAENAVKEAEKKKKEQRAAAAKAAKEKDRQIKEKYGKKKPP